VFVADFLLHGYTASSHLEFLFTPAAIADLVTTISIAAGLNLNFLRLIRVYVLTRVTMVGKLFS
jgi:hypothetical protein